MNPAKPGQPLWTLLSVLYKSHPWHGVSPGDHLPDVVQSFVEMVPSDTVKYEIDKISGYLRVDRPQKYSSVCPALYGFIPQTLCGDRVAELSSLRTGLKLHGDGDPLDICILTDRHILHGNVLAECIPIGGLRMLDHNEADDKIIAVLKDDSSCGGWRNVQEVPDAMLDRLRHYFLTYKLPPDSDAKRCSITHVYDVEEAREVIRRSLADYQAQFGNLDEILTEALNFKR